MKANFESRFEQFGREMEAVWSEMLSNSKFVNTIQNGSVDKSLYAIYMIESYYCASHNARNHALIGVRHAEDASYAKFCFEHAALAVFCEEMALSGAMNIGLNQQGFEIPKPLRATKNLIAHVGSIASAGNVIQRIGYSYCAAMSYQHINPLIDFMRQCLGLAPSPLTFSIADFDVGVDRSSGMKNMMERVCKTDDDWANVAKVIREISRLNFAVMEASCEEYMHYRAWQLERSGIVYAWHEDAAVPIAA